MTASFMRRTKGSGRELEHEHYQDGAANCRGAATALIITLVSVALRRYQRRISALATTDQLTELPNRRGFNLLANQAMQEARRNQSALCVLMLDLDNFKQLNDSQGHMAGDETLPLCQPPAQYRAQIRHYLPLGR